MQEQPDPAIGGLGARLAAARRAAFVGRAAELELFRSTVETDPPPFAVLHLHGPGGIGKSTLLDEFAAIATQAGRRVVRLDGRDLDPTPRGVGEGLAAALAVSADEVTAALAGGDPAVLLVDTFERLRPVETWLRDTLLPQLPQDALVVLAGRRAPDAGWRADPAWNELLRTMALRELRQSEAGELLAGRGVTGRARSQALEVVRGHPLGLVLIADVLTSAEPDTELQSLTDAPEIIDALVTRLVRQVPDEAHRRALYVAAIAGVVTEGMLHDVLDGPVRQLFEWLRDLSFATPVVAGVALHELTADAINAELRWRDEGTWVELHTAITRHVQRRITGSSGPEQHRRRLDLLRLYRHHPVTRRFFQLAPSDDRWVDPATPDDHTRILELTRAHEGEESARIVAHWLAHQPDAFWAFRRDGTRPPVGFAAQLRTGGGTDEHTGVDPVLDAVRDHVRAHGPVRGDEAVLVMRHWVTEEDHQAVAGHHLVSARAAQEWVATPQLAWAFVLLVDPELYAPVFEFIDFARLDWQVEIGGHTFGGFARDMRSTSVTDWLDLLRDRRAAVGEVTAPATDKRRLLVLAQDEFARAVRDALRGVARPDGLRDNPLLRSRLVADREEDDADDALRTLLREVTEALADHPRDDKLRRALLATYFSPAPTQEAAAERLDLPFSTFRRHLTGGIERITERLWERELYGP